MAPTIATVVVVHQCVRPGLQLKALSASSSDCLATEASVTPRTAAPLSDGPTNVGGHDHRRRRAGHNLYPDQVLRGGGGRPDQVPHRADRLPGVLARRDGDGVRLAKEERAGLIASEPDKFMLPRPSDVRYNWVHVRLDALRPRRASRDRHRGVADVCAKKGGGDGPLVDFSAPGCLLCELDPGGKPEFCVNVREVRLNCSW